MSRKEDLFEKLPPINQKSLFIDLQAAIPSPRNSFSSSRRNSTYRRLSINQNPEQIAQHSVTFATKSESDILKDCVPLLNYPRFSCELSIEGRFAVFKGYEKILIEELEKSNPEFIGVINRTSNTVSNTVNSVTLNRELIRQRTEQFDKELQNLSTLKDKKKNLVNKRNQHRKNDDLNSSSSEEYEIQNKARLLMGRYLQFAHLILDNLKTADVVKSSKYLSKLNQKKFNSIQALGWWNTTWQENFIQKYQSSKISN